MRRVLTISGLLMLAFSVRGSNAQEVFDSANAQYQRQDFESAISGYLQLADEGYRATELFYNLGNAYYKTGKVAPAILYFERALKMDPHDEDILHNLGMANLQVVDKVKPIEQNLVSKEWEKFINTFSFRGWSWIGVSLLWLALITGVLFLIIHQRRLKQGLFIFSIVILFAWGFSMYMAGQKDRLDNKGDFGIVFATNSYIKSEPASSSKDLFILHEGVKVKILEQKDDWIKIRFDQNRVGWIPEGDLEGI